MNLFWLCRSHQIADLQVIGKAAELAEQKKNINFVKNDLNYSPESSSGGGSSSDSADNEEEREDVTGGWYINFSLPLLTWIILVPHRNVTIPQPAVHHYKIAKPKPRKIQPPPVNNVLLVQEDFARKIANLKIADGLEDKVGVKDFGRGGNSVDLLNSKSTPSGPPPPGNVKLGALSCFLRELVKLLILN